MCTNGEREEAVPTTRRDRSTGSARLLAALLLAGCAGPPAGEDVDEVQEPSYYFGEARTIITVCIEADGYSSALADEAKRTLRATWGKAANVTFLGFELCDPATRATMLPLTFQPKQLLPDGSYRTGYTELQLILSTPTDTRRHANYVWVLNDDTTGPSLPLFRHTVVHEFGHVLGFAHEQERPDNWVGEFKNIWVYCGITDFTPTGQPVLSVPGGQMLTPYDMASVMHYCQPGASAPKLSPWDIFAARAIYGRNPYAHGFLIKSDRNAALAARATASEGAPVTLTDQCTNTNPECTWSYQNGMLVSDSDPTYAINAYNGAAFGTILRLTRYCTPTNPDCTWTYKHGEFLSDKNAALAINAWNGAYVGTTLALHNQCSSTNPDCTWTLPNVMLSSAQDPALGVYATGGAHVNGGLSLNQACSPLNLDCTWTFSHGLIRSDRNAALAMTSPTSVVAGASVVHLTSTCTSSTAGCTWSWQHGQLYTDYLRGISAVPLAGALNGAQVGLDLCAMGTACMLDGQFAQYTYQLQGP